MASTWNATQSLHSVLYPCTFTFRLEAVSDKISIVPIEPEEVHTSTEEPPDEDLGAEFGFDSTLPVDPADKVIMLESLLYGGGYSVGRVLLRGKEMICKALASGLRDSRLAKELAAHHKIQDASPDTSVCVSVPRLLGYVSHAHNGSIIGLLHEWIPGENLRHMDMASVPVATRRKWASQILETVGQLHRMGVVWDDGKAANVVIDNEQEAWLIDFGGGWTEEWVDEELTDSAEGDDQAAMRISEFLGA